MARLLFGGDDVDVRGPYGAAVLSASGRTGIVYLDAAGTTLADIVTYPAGAAIAGSVITVSPDSQLPLFQGPADGTDTLYVSVDGHAPAPIYTNVDARLDLLATNVAGRLNWRGAWAATTAYATNDLVTFNGGLYRAPNNFTSAGAFVLANWVELHPQIGTYGATAPADPGQMAGLAVYQPLAPQYGYANISFDLPVLALRFDDAYAADFTSIFPLLQARKLVAGFAITSSFVGQAGRMTWGQVKSLQDAGNQIMAHSSTHGVDPASLAEFVVETTTAGAAVKAQNCWAEAFVQPGTWVGNYNFTTAAQFDAPEGRWLQANFASVEAYLLDYLIAQNHAQPFPVSAPYGVNHQSPGSTLATNKKWVDDLVNGGGLISLELLMHSGQFGTAGNPTLADFTTLLDYITAYRDAGQLYVITPTARVFAKPGPPANLLADPTFDQSTGTTLAESWTSTHGAPSVVANGGARAGHNALRISSANYTEQALRVTNVRTARFTVWAKNATPGANSSVRMLIRSSDGATIYSTTDVSFTTSDTWAQYGPVYVGSDPRATVVEVFAISNAPSDGSADCLISDMAVNKW